MKRYKFLTNDSSELAFHKLINSLSIASKTGRLKTIVNGLLTDDERIKIGRRIQVSEMLNREKTFSEIMEELKVGKNTIAFVETKMQENPECFDLILKKSKGKPTKKRKYRVEGGSKLVFKRKIY